MMHSQNQPVECPLKLIFLTYLSIGHFMHGQFGFTSIHNAHINQIITNDFVK